VKLKRYRLEGIITQAIAKKYGRAYRSSIKTEVLMRIVGKYLIGWVCLLMLAAVPMDRASWAAVKPPPSDFVRQLSALAGPRDAILLAAPDGRTIAAIHEKRALVPASILKLLTTLTALKKLGPDYRFRTDFYLDSHHNLKIKGYGDPLLVSEKLKGIARHLATLVPAAHNLVLDDSYFVQPLRIPGRGCSTQPYDAPNGALCVNFNTVAFKKVNGGWASDEPQTPLLPSVIPKIAATGITRGRITLATDRSEAVEYAGNLFRYFLKRAGMRVTGNVAKGRVDPASDELLWSYRSDATLGEVVNKLLRFSNNFIANQILLVMGAEILGPPATVDKGLQVLRSFYRENLGIGTGRIVEGSGISRGNRITAQAMLKILQRYKPYHTLMRRKGHQFYKTGHLNGVRTRAGFLSGADGQMYRFVVMCNTPGKNTHAIMAAIKKWYLNKITLMRKPITIGG
jgi:D-alanyl-D-alanine carboxypeptidase/D-alanyl-D-alanine-endopeptidase (penicillin-binding protein 4)